MKTRQSKDQAPISTESFPLSRGGVNRRGQDSGSQGSFSDKKRKTKEEMEEKMCPNATMRLKTRCPSLLSANVMKIDEQN